MKKGIMVLVLVTMIAGGAFTQEIKNWISGEVGILGFGGRYERMLNEKFSIGGVAFWNYLVFANAWGVSAAARFYPSAGSFYVECDVGFGMADYWYWWYRYYPTYGFMITPAVGWKIDFGSPGGFFINPMITMPIVFLYSVKIHPRIAIGLGGAF